MGRAESYSAGLFSPSHVRGPLTPRLCVPPPALQICEGLPEGEYVVLSADPSKECSFEGGVANCGGGPSPPVDPETEKWMKKRQSAGTLGG